MFATDISVVYYTNVFFVRWPNLVSNCISLFVFAVPAATAAVPAPVTATAATRIPISVYAARDERIRVRRRRQRVRAVLKPAGDVHRARGVRRHIRGGRVGQWHVGAGFHPAPEHAQRAQHVHTEPGAGRPVGNRHVRAVHVHRVHGRVVAVRRAHMQAQRGHQRRIHRSFRVHVDGAECREVSRIPWYPKPVSASQTV